MGLVNAANPGPISTNVSVVLGSIILIIFLMVSLFIRKFCPYFLEANVF
ncbi:hypothetical protein CWQ_00750 [Buchnera aphidicola str. TLW03 (Acyrthosiphon pisum)]|nr:hypothetical protein CWQ_00750 [Buchnera aphidicola str. TLW03 (Acyrthosiphon pisum)]